MSKKEVKGVTEGLSITLSPSRSQVQKWKRILNLTVSVRKRWQTITAEVRPISHHDVSGINNGMALSSTLGSSSWGRRNQRNKCRIDNTSGKGRHREKLTVQLQCQSQKNSISVLNPGNILVGILRACTVRLYIESSETLTEIKCKCFGYGISS